MYFLIAGTDYGGVVTTVTFEPGDTEQFVDISIVNDDVLEGVEMFTATLTIDDSNVDISSNDTATITITDDDSKPPLLFHSSFSPDQWGYYWDQCYTHCAHNGSKESQKNKNQFPLPICSKYNWCSYSHV